MDRPQIRWTRSPLDAATRPRALAALSESERERYVASSGVTSEPFLAGRWLLRTLVADVAGVAPELVIIAAVCPDCGGQHGAPAVVGLEVSVSLSRAGGIVVAAASAHARVGIDVEVLEQPSERLDAIAALTGHRSIQHWTRVEAVLKADGRGLRLDPRSVLVSGDRAVIAGEPAIYDLREVEMSPGLCVTVASEAMSASA